MLLSCAHPTCRLVLSSIALNELILLPRSVFITALASARVAAVTKGKAQDVALNPETRVLRFGGETHRLPATFNIAVHTARELNRNREGIIRFYPEGGSSGGDIDIAQPNGTGVKISVDWLAGRVTQQKYEFD